MKKILSFILIGMFLLTFVSALPIEKEVTGESCGRYMILSTGDKYFPTFNKVRFNKDSTCVCQKYSKIPIWIYNQETQSVFMAYTCKEIQ